MKLFSTVPVFSQNLTLLFYVLELGHLYSKSESKVIDESFINNLNFWLAVQMAYVIRTRRSDVTVDAGNVQLNHWLEQCTVWDMWNCLLEFALNI